MASKNFENERDQLIDYLTSCFSKDLLTTEEFEKRVELANKASTKDELYGLLEDLPSPSFEQSTEKSLFVRSSPPAKRSRPRAPRRYGPREAQSTFVLFSEQKYIGNWLRNDRVDTSNILGSTTLDLRDCELNAYTEINLFCLLGEVKVIIPPGVQVESSVSPFMASVNRKNRSRYEQNDGPTVHIKGFVALGEVNIRIRD